MERRGFLVGALVVALKQLFGGRSAQAARVSGPGAKAPPRKGKYLEFLNWKQAGEEFARKPVVILPIGARTKEHGLHLPLNNDFVMAEYLTRRALDECAVLALPTVEYGFYPAFVEYPGSVNISHDTFRDYVADICRSIHRHGPSKFYALNTGISTLRPLKAARELLAKEGITLEYTNLLEATKEAEERVRQQKLGTHADEIETSMMLYIAPGIVDMKAARDDSHPEKGPGPLTRDEHATAGTYSPTGAWGNPTLATREKGKIVVEALVANIVAAVKVLGGAS